MATLIDGSFDLEMSVTMKAIGPRREDGFQPAIRRTYRLKCAPNVLGELHFSRFIGAERKALYWFSTLFADSCHMDQFLHLESVEEINR